MSVSDGYGEVFQDLFGMTFDAVVFLDGFMGAEAHGVRVNRIVEPRFKGIGKRFGRVGREGSASCRSIDNFREGAVGGLDHWDAGCHGFDGIKPESFRITGGHGEYGQVAQMLDFFIARYVLAYAVAVLKPGLVKLANLLVDVLLVVGEGGAGDPEFSLGGYGFAFMEQDEGVD